MKRILFMIPTLSHGGAERVLTNLVNRLDKSKYDITVKTLFDSGVYREMLNKDVKYKYVFSSSFKGNTYYFRLFSPQKLFKKYVDTKYDIVISYLEGPTARIIGGCDSTVKVCWIHSDLTDDELFSRSFRNMKEAVDIYGGYDKLIAVSETVKNSMKLRLPNSDISVLYNTVDSAEILRLSSQLPDDITFDSSVPMVCSVGRLREVKGFDRLIRVHKRLLNEGIYHKVYIFGEGDEKSNLNELIKEQSVSNTFILAGHKENPFKYVSRCDLFVCSSRREGFSTAVTEALILGTSVVSTDCSGAYELLGEHDEYGIVTENSEDGLYCGMKRMLTDKRTLDYYKEKARERGNRFSTEKTVKAVEDMLDNL